VFTLQRIDGKPIFGDGWGCEKRDQPSFIAEGDTMELTRWFAHYDLFCAVGQ
jgi:hypothetical protein